MKFNIKRMRAGEYLVNNRYDIRKISNHGAGCLYDSGPTWVWSDLNQIGVGSPYLSTKAQAVESLRLFLGGEGTAWFKRDGEVVEIKGGE